MHLLSPASTACHACLLRMLNAAHLCQQGQLMVGLAGLANSGRVDVWQQLLCARHQQVEVHPACAGGE
jgi:hypothetical protein